MKENKKVLVVEDDGDDLFLAKRVLAKAGITAVSHAADGIEAIDYLSGAGRYADRKSYPLPDVVFLDLKMPSLSGYQVLQWIRKRPDLSALPVYVLTSSDEPRDRQRVAEIGAAGYFVKPLSVANVHSTGI